MNPTRTSIATVSRILREAAEAVERGASIEGLLEWSGVGLDRENPDLGPEEVEFRGAFRVSTTTLWDGGQGGIRIFGAPEEEDPPDPTPEGPGKTSLKPSRKA